MPLDLFFDNFPFPTLGAYAQTAGNNTTPDIDRPWDDLDEDFG